MFGRNDSLANEATIHLTGAHNPDASWFVL